MTQQDFSPNQHHHQGSKQQLGQGPNQQHGQGPKQQHGQGPNLQNRQGPNLQNQQGLNDHNREPSHQHNGHSQQPTMHKNPLQQQQQKKMCAKYCSPGAMSSFLNLRKKQMHVASRAANEGHENTLVANESHENTVANEGHENTTSSYSNDLQQGCDELWKYLISSEGKRWTLETLNEEWKGWKCRIKAKYYSSYATYDERWDKRPNTIPENQFKELLHYWDDEATKDESERNISNRQLVTDMHTMGPTSFAFMREQLKQEDPNKEEPSKAKVYAHSRKRKPGKSYKTSFGEIAANIVRTKYNL
ncbi:S-antigen protein [Bienertia sinuspersici]